MEQFIVEVKQSDLDLQNDKIRSGKIKLIEAGEKTFCIYCKDDWDGDKEISIWPREWGWAGRREFIVLLLGKTNSFLTNMTHLIDAVKDLKDFKDEAIIKIV